MGLPSKSTTSAIIPGKGRVADPGLVAIAALGCGIAFVLGRNIGSNLSEKDGLALTQTVYQNYLRMLSQLPEAELRQRFPDEVVEMLKPKPPHP